MFRNRHSKFPFHIKATNVTILKISALKITFILEYVTGTQLQYSSVIFRFIWIMIFLLGI